MSLFAALKARFKSEDPQVVSRREFLAAAIIAGGGLIVPQLLVDIKGFKRAQFIVDNGGQYTITWPSKITWPESPPTLMRNGTDIITIEQKFNGPIRVTKRCMIWD